MRIFETTSLGTPPPTIRLAAVRRRSCPRAAAHATVSRSAFAAQLFRFRSPLRYKLRNSRRLHRRAGTSAAMSMAAETVNTAVTVTVASEGATP